MADFTVISDIGNSLVKILRENLVPDVIMNPESIGLCNPEDKGDMILGIYLYDIKENEEVRNSGMISMGVGKVKYPSSYLTLSYMITVYSNGDVKFRAEEEHKILGRVLQVMMDNSMLDPFSFKPVEQGDGTQIQISMQNLSQDEKLKIWTVPNKAYRLSLFFKVGPVELSSAKEKSVQRVVDVDFVVKEQ